MVGPDWVDLPSSFRLRTNYFSYTCYFLQKVFDSLECGAYRERLVRNGARFSVFGAGFWGLFMSLFLRAIHWFFFVV